MSDQRGVQGTYDRIADEYVRRIFHELDDKPFDRESLTRFARRVRELGPGYDIGCGPGHVARYLHDHASPAEDHRGGHSARQAKED